MTTRIMGLVWPLRLDPSAKAVLVSLADQANDAGVCWPSVGSISERTCLGERTVQQAIGRLMAMGLLEVRVQGAPAWGGKRLQSNLYVINLQSCAGLHAQQQAQERARDAVAVGGSGEPDLGMGTPAAAAPPQQPHPHPRSSCTQTVN